MGAQDFSEEQRRYLEGFVSGVQAGRVAKGLKPLGALGSGTAEPTGPDAPHLKAMARTEADGKKLVNEEKAKRDDHPFDAYTRLKSEAEAGQFPKGVDNFRWRFHGLFYVAPNEDFFMCRLRIPNGILKHWQFAGVADLAERHGGGFAHVTTRANLQIREIPAAQGPALIERLSEIGLACKGAGADNIRNVTGAPTAGIDPQELIDTRPYARAWHHHILNNRTLYGLPRKFNVGFDGGGIIPVLEDTNDIAFTAVTVTGGAEPGVWFRLGLGGITGHQDFARPTGAYVKPDEAVRVADAIVRVYIDHGDRTNRTKARLKYLLDAWGFEKFLAAVEEKLGRKLARLPDEAVIAPPRQDRQAHVGVHPQSQDGLVWVGVVLPVGKMTSAQMRGIAEISRALGDGDIRLTVWQNLLISGVRAENAETVEARLREIGLTAKATSVRAGLIACTGNKGCKFAASDTKGTAMAIADWVEPRVAMDAPVNIHLTGCHHSCAQHYIGDIGLLATRVPLEGSDDTVEGFHVLVGGGFGPDAMIGREVFHDVKAEDCPRLVEKMLRGYMAGRAGAGESFQAFTRRHEPEALNALFDAVEAAE
ncbi:MULTISPECIES: NirA family protein [Rhodomicrobium]|uniref:NirA family protein n=1 Tax=Rhodomicrobium TaxID=1068 RepID=UPI000B4A7209|nr:MULTISPECIES: NirA family protein [Rhodomicrobium]